MRSHTLDADVADLVDELRVLGVEDPLFILLGQKTARAFHDRETILANGIGLAQIRSVTVPHYSAANGAKHGNRPDRYRSIVLAALGKAS
ncbi:hypothetical protein ACFWUP_30985 [Nocardia sp. NPDC058658]|uniref:hypothetical protein n=1 Tax=Nocardia sp. NPDC058658 TaxID=3346580 RepID=UPI00364AE658